MVGKCLQTDKEITRLLYRDYFIIILVKNFDTQFEKIYYKIFISNKTYQLNLDIFDSSEDNLFTDTVEYSIALAKNWINMFEHDIFI